ncbi:MAG: hypothetical protein M1814_005547 [Vezdaea aestivalis]|nr:MAG: hypothetical protein M1814_005547 [Vezdaea aestivalis]
MPSTRRIKVTAVLIALLIFTILYLTSDAREQSSEFRMKTEEALKKAEISRKMNEQLKNAEAAAKKSADDKLPLPNKAPLNSPPPPGTTQQWKVSSEAKKPVGKGMKKQKNKAEEKVKTAEETAVEEEMGVILKRGPIIIFSKSYCPYSKKAKDILLNQYKISPPPQVIELDEHVLGPQLQDQLKRMTGRRTVPNILINGKSIGGGDDIEQLDHQNELSDKIRSLGGKRMVEVSRRS